MAVRAMAIPTAVTFNGDGSRQVTFTFVTATVDDTTGLMATPVAGTANVNIPFGLSPQETDAVLRVGAAATITSNSSLYIKPEDVFFPLTN